MIDVRWNWRRSRRRAVSRGDLHVDTRIGAQTVNAGHDATVTSVSALARASPLIFTSGVPSIFE